MDHAEDRLGGTVLVDLEQRDGDRPFRHIADEVHGAVDIAGAPVAFTGAALLRTVVPQAVERFELRQPLAEETHQLVVDVQVELGGFLRHLQPVQLPGRGLFAQHVLARVHRDAGHGQRHFLQFHRHLVSSCAVFLIPAVSHSLLPVGRFYRVFPVSAHNAPNSPAASHDSSTACSHRSRVCANGSAQSSVRNPEGRLASRTVSRDHDAATVCSG